MWDITNFKLTIGSMASLATILLGKIFAVINWPTMSTVTSLFGIVVACFTCVHYWVQIRKNLRETPPRVSRKMKKFFNSKK